MDVRIGVQEAEGVDELPRVLGGGGLVEPPARGLLQGLVQLRGGVFHDEEEPVRVVEVAVAGHDVRVLDPAVDLHLLGVLGFVGLGWGRGWLSSRRGGRLVGGSFDCVHARPMKKKVNRKRLRTYLVADLVHHAVRLQLILEEHLLLGRRTVGTTS